MFGEFKVQVHWHPFNLLIFKFHKILKFACMLNLNISLDIRESCIFIVNIHTNIFIQPLNDSKTYILILIDNEMCVIL